MKDSSNSSVPGVNISSKNNIHSRTDSITKIIWKIRGRQQQRGAIIRGNTITNSRYNNSGDTTISGNTISKRILRTVWTSATADAPKTARTTNNKRSARDIRNTSSRKDVNSRRGGKSRHSSHTRDLIHFLYIFFWRARVCRPLLCLCRPFMIFEGCLDSNPEYCRSKLARYRLSHPSL